MKKFVGRFMPGQNEQEGLEDSSSDSTTLAETIKNLKIY
jgi:hypothetical protein